MNNLKFYLSNLLFQSNLLISFFLENETLLSPYLISIIDQAQLELRDLLQVKAEIGLKLSLFESIETVCKHPRYFMTDRPSELIQLYSAQPEFTTMSPAFTSLMLISFSINI